MALEEYRRKRDFSKTGEPPPGKVTARNKQLSYLIQKHDATRLHYDFRLELDGVLLSWAVTKGPSLDPADKRLAVRTEDHPLAYGSFEGTIPKGEYGGGTVMLWDRGTWEPKGDPHAGLKKGHLTFELHGERLKGGWDLVRMRGGGKRENWLLIKEADQDAIPGSNGAFLERLASSVTTGRSMEEIAQGVSPAKRRNPDPKTAATLKRLMDRYPEVQLATLVDKAPEGEAWVHEIKFDGYRLLGFVAAGEARLRTRNGNDWTGSFPAIASALQKLKVDSAVLDMEAVLLDSEGKSSFQALQAALGGGGHPERIVAYGFDLLHLDGNDLTRLSLTERKEALQALLANPKQSFLRYSEHFAVDGAEMYEQACAKSLEGIVSKRSDAPYVAGRQKTWLKVKCSLRQEFIIVGYSSAKSGERAIGALYLGYRKDGALKYAGKVGTGFTMQSARELAERLRRIECARPILTRAETKGMGSAEWHAVHWVTPELLCEVAFTEWTDDGRIRHPSFQGLRQDKDAAEVNKEKPMKSDIPASPAPHAEKPGVLVAAGVRISHPDRVISETGLVTKGALAEYHAAVAPFMLPRIARHPLSLLRCPSGIDGKECFFQRSPGRGLGKDVRPFEFRHKGKRYEYLYIDDEKGLLEIIQMGAIEIHPWGASVDAIDYPDRLILDLDPATDVPFEALRLAAADLRQRLERKGLESSLKCTGGKGLHVTVPLAGKNRWPEVKAFGAAVAEEMVSATPEAYVATMSKAKRTGKIFIDYFRNDYTATAIADYGVRARPGAPVAVPLAWDELKGLKSASAFTMTDVLKRLKHRKPPTKPKGQVLPS
ncbi:MAG TPA: DNA ligase D [Bryobacteraceae bacterium]|nr:DNA ligase D [Bryobacteraceae bacterium]